MKLIQTGLFGENYAAAKPERPKVEKKQAKQKMLFFVACLPEQLNMFPDKCVPDDLVGANR